VLKEQVQPPGWGRLYAVNTLGAVSGSLVSAWVLLPAIGFVRSAWVFGALALVAAIPCLPRAGRGIALAAFGLAIPVAVFGESRIGHGRVLGNFNSPVTRVLAFDEGPDSSIAVADNAHGDRMLVIDGFAATDQSSAAHYMVWMGRLPMLLHPSPRSALVICFGTGQTANAVRSEGPLSLDVVELEPAVFRFAPLFDANRHVLDDPRVHPVVMDGRAWLRRTRHRYDVITLEPMPPNFAGVNSLYSREFYALAASRLNSGGVLAQWVPFHLLSPHDALAIAATFADVFPDTLLWVDPRDGTGILVGKVGDSASEIGASWPGFARTSIPRDMEEAAVRSRVVLGPRAVARYALGGEIITDDNQLLAYGPERQRNYRIDEDPARTNAALVLRAARAGSPP
jgi:spermidine synthase